MSENRESISSQGIEQKLNERIGVNAPREVWIGEKLVIHPVNLNSTQIQSQPIAILVFRNCVFQQDVSIGSHLSRGTIRFIDCIFEKS